MGSKARPHVAAQRWFQRGVRAAEGGDLARAERAYRAAIAAVPTFAEAHTNLGTTLQMQGQLREAEAAYRTAVALDATSANAWANLGSVSCALDQLDQAEAHYRRALELDPEAAHNHAGLGAVLHARAHYGGAAGSLRRAIQLAPMWSEPRRALGLALFRAGDHAACVDACLTALAIDAGDATARSVLGLALVELGQLAAAAVELARVIELAPGSSAARFNLGIVLERLDRHDEAADAYRVAIACDPRNVQAQLNLAGAMMRLRRFDEAIAGYRAVLALDPDEPTARHLVAALTGQTTPTAPAGYVRALFDHTAPGFDSHLRGLDYAAPAMIRRVLERELATPLARVLDLGCGTGLVGAELRDLSGELCGVDLSPGMIAAAERRGIYDHLYVADAVEYLRAGTELFDVVTAGDVVIYLGDLAPLLAALRPRLRASGLFVFSIEVGEGAFALARTGRYTHSDAYVEAAAQEHGFLVASRERLVLRREHGEPVDGCIVALRVAGDHAARA